MSNTHPFQHSLLRSASVAFLWMAGVTIWTANSQLIFAQMASGGGFTLGTTQMTAQMELAQGNLHNVTTVYDIQAPVDTVAVQLLLGTLFLSAGFFLYALLLQKTGEKLRFPFHTHVRRHASHAKRMFGGWMDREMYPRAQ